MKPIKESTGISTIIESRSFSTLSGLLVQTLLAVIIYIVMANNT